VKTSKKHGRASTHRCHAPHAQPRTSTLAAIHSFRKLGFHCRVFGMIVPLCMANCALSPAL